MSADVFVGKNGVMPQTTYVDAYYWRCDICGWLGTNLSSIEAAMREAGDHFTATHDDGRSTVQVERRDVALAWVRRNGSPATPGDE